MKTIAIDIRALLEPDWGGISWFTYYLTDGLIKQASQNNLRIFLFYNQRKLLNCSMVQLLKKWNVYQNVKIKSYKIPNKILNLSMNILNYPYVDELLTIEQSSNRAIDYFILPNLSFIALSDDVKRIAVCHDLSFEVFPEFFTVKQKIWHKLTNPREFYRKAHKIIAVSKNTKQDLIDLYGIDDSKITVIYPGIDHQKFRPYLSSAGETMPLWGEDENRLKLQQVKQKYSLPNNFILFIGTLEPRKNLETLIEAYDVLRGKLDKALPCLYIVGHEGWKFDRIYRFWLRAKHKHQIRFINQIDSADLPALYNLAKIFVYPSFYEGFGFPPLEAIACGTPVIAGHGSSLPEIIGNAGLLIDPFDVADLSYAIERLLSDQKLYDRLKMIGIKRAGEFGWKETAQTFINCLC